MRDTNLIVVNTSIYVLVILGTSLFWLVAGVFYVQHKARKIFMEGYERGREQKIAEERESEQREHDANNAAFKEKLREAASEGLSLDKLLPEDRKIFSCADGSCGSCHYCLTRNQAQL